jgi:4-hydroxythreonine-4-phosphate dehydrogenase
MKRDTRPKTTPWIAVTTGDPAGVGPEIVAHLFAAFRPERSRALLVGAPSVMGPWFDRFGFSCPMAASLDDLGAAGKPEPSVALLDTGVTEAVPVGEDSRAGGRHAGRAIEIACELAENRAVAGIVTAPISKKSLNLADFHYSGHTEMLARYLNSPLCQMMMVHENLRVVPLSRHLPVRDVAGWVTGERIEAGVGEVWRALRERFGVASPRIAVAGLNPHAGDGGVIGHEEADVIAPALDRLRARGLEVDGPFAADAMFQAAFAAHYQGEGPGYDAYVAMYHDQALIPFKMAARRRGVNVTVGLPIVRTSVDHGTAYDIAGRGIAETESLLAAYKLAEVLTG